MSLEAIAIFTTVGSGFALLGAVFIGGIAGSKRKITVPRVVLLTIFVGAIATGAYASKPYKYYKPQTITVKTAGTKIEQICRRWRPTWHISACKKQVQSQNAAVNLERLRPGERLFLAYDDDQFEGYNL